MSLTVRSKIIALCIVATALAGSPAACAQTSDATTVQHAIIPIEDFARGPAVSSVAVSPDGSRIASIESVDGREAIVVADIDGGNRVVRYRDPARSIGNVAWSSSGRWLYFLHDRGGDEGYHLFRLDSVSIAPPTDLTPFPGVSVELVRTVDGKRDAVLAAINQRNPEYPDVFQIDVENDRATEIVRNPDRFIEFFADRSGGVAAATSIESDGALVLHAREGEGDWKPIYRAGPDERFKILGADDAPHTLLVKSNHGHGEDRILSLDLRSGRVRTRVRHACGRFDAEDVVVDRMGLAATTCVTDKAEVHAVRRSVARAVSAALRSIGKDHGLWIESSSADGSTIAFYTNASDDPGRFLLWSERTGLRALAEMRPWLSPDRLAKSAHQWVAARDGLALSTYITRPRGAQGATPAIVAIHGGPWTRDSGGFESDSQLLANRGYTVIQINFRGSTGLGKKVFEAGIGQFGAAMSDDIDDVVRDLVSKGVIDSGRVCLLGGSYGGYAVLMGLTRSTFRYRCGIDYAGPAHLVTLMESFPPSWRPYLPRSWYRFVGDPADPKKRARMLERSPLLQADRITAPLLVFQGVNDPRVTQPQSDAIVCSLRKRGVDVAYLLADNEGHSFANEETRLAVNHGVEQFLSRQLGGGMQASTPESTLAAYRRLIEYGQTQAVCGP